MVGFPTIVNPDWDFFSAVPGSSRTHPQPVQQPLLEIF
jgi:hypothetical protein